MITTSPVPAQPTQQVPQATSPATAASPTTILSPSPAQIQVMIDSAVAAALASQKSSWSWAAIRGNKYFVAATSALGGALASEAYRAAQTGGFVWNTKAIESMVGTALLTTVTALYHLYTTPKPSEAS